MFHIFWSSLWMKKNDQNEQTILVSLLFSILYILLISIDSKDQEMYKLSNPKIVLTCSIPVVSIYFQAKWKLVDPDQMASFRSELIWIYSVFKES